ncbi:Hypothetical predicted protein [Paramuricea clavata]|uniref:RING-type domain-containing protein n=1 Tax=Paramuricea clavata TaxID=317549 RepID=A0A6S7I7N9_PARCT|nr:Hypothetical predicted protein [Paramuricea clavata]
MAGKGGHCQTELIDYCQTNEFDIDPDCDCHKIQPELYFDAFTGCQILPCSHKVHKECATQMIRSGITRCPICRESFEHKLERRPHP